MNPPADDRNAPLDGLHELRGIESEPDWQAMETRLVSAFAAIDKAPDASGAANGATRTSWHWMAAAAAVVLAAAITFYPLPGRPGARGVKPAEPGPPVKPPVPTATAPATPPSGPPQDGTVKPVQPRGRVNRTAATRASAAEPVFDDFIALPGAFALPDFESGRIVRVEVPLTVLPAYGIELVPDAPAAVEADFLIGQDGVPRAIRLAANAQRH